MTQPTVPPTAGNVPSAATPPPRRRFRLLTALLIVSLGLNAVVCGAAYWWWDDDDDGLSHHHLYGDADSKNYVAVVRIDGVLMEGLNGFVFQQLNQVARDDRVKVIVLRINSPGGTIGASEDIHRELLRIRDGNHPRIPDARGKKIIVSMGAIAASGGYYVAMPGEKIYAEPTCITGSIGVYASLPNISKFAEEHGIRMDLIKAGGIKASGSPFHEMTPQERQPWQDMVDQAYDRFLEVVSQGRPQLSKETLRDQEVLPRSAHLHDTKGNRIRNEKGELKTVPVTRRRADGGSFTSAEAKAIGLIDEIGVLEDAVTAAVSAAGLQKYQVIQYERPVSLVSSLIGLKQTRMRPALDAEFIGNALTPRMWYLAPHGDITGLLIGGLAAER